MTYEVEQFRLLAHYNLRQNQQVQAAALRLCEPELSADRGAYFGSILGTLNHIVVADTIWLQRFGTHPANFESLRLLSEQPRPDSLAQQVAADLSELAKLRSSLDRTICEFAAELAPEHLSWNLAFQDMRSRPFRKPFHLLLLHFFNHQTHHRGQIGTLLMQRGIDVGVTDLLDDIPVSPQ